MSDFKTLTREELYNLIWSKPMVKLTPELGISNVGLSKICKRLGVPRPPQGYWIQKELGKAYPIPALPKGDYPSSHTIHPLDATSYPKTEALQALKVQESKPESKIVVPPLLENLHPWIVAAQKEFERNSKTLGFISIYGVKCPDIYTTLAQAPRALRIFNALLHALEERKIKIWLERGRTWLVFEEETLQISLREKSARRHYTPAEKAEFKKANTYSWYTPPNFVDEPCGRLCFFMKDEKESYYGYTHTIEERPINPLENRINDIIMAMGRMAAAIKARRQESEERQARWAKEAKEREAQERVRRQEQQRMDKFTEWVGQWRESCHLYTFLQELESLIKDLPSNHEAWEIHRVAKQRLTTMNPLTNGKIQELQLLESEDYT